MNIVKWEKLPNGFLECSKIQYGGNSLEKDFLAYYDEGRRKIMYGIRMASLSRPYSA